MAEGNYDVRTNIKQRDEIGQLSSSLDLLAEGLSYNVDALYQEKNKLRDIIASITEGLLAFDTDMKLINHNESVISIFEYVSTESLEENIAEELDKMGFLELFKDSLSKGEPLSRVSDFKGKKLKFHISPVKSNNGDIIGVVSLIADISESERLEQIRRDFVANVSHEFRTPLTLIRGSVEAIIDGAVTEIDEIKNTTSGY